MVEGLGGTGGRGVTKGRNESVLFNPNPIMLAHFLLTFCR